MPTKDKLMIARGYRFKDLTVLKNKARWQAKQKVFGVHQDLSHFTFSQYFINGEHLKSLSIAPMLT